MQYILTCYCSSLTYTKNIGCQVLEDQKNIRDLIRRTNCARQKQKQPNTNNERTPNNRTLLKNTTTPQPHKNQILLKHYFKSRVILKGYHMSASGVLYFCHSEI